MQIMSFRREEITEILQEAIRRHYTPNVKL